MPSRGKPLEAEISKLLDLLDAYEQGEELEGEELEESDFASGVEDNAHDIGDRQFDIEDAPEHGQAPNEDDPIIELMQIARDQPLAKALPDPPKPAVEPAENRFASHIVRGMWKIRGE
jgi:hypothetical protein